MFLALKEHLTALDSRLDWDLISATAVPYRVYILDLLRFVVVVVVFLFFFVKASL